MHPLLPIRALAPRLTVYEICHPSTLSASENATAQPIREVLAHGHRFEDNLRCPCGVDWETHQLDPTPCALDARMFGIRSRGGSDATPSTCRNGHLRDARHGRAVVQPSGAVHWNCIACRIEWLERQVDGARR